MFYWQRLQVPLRLSAVLESRLEIGMLVLTRSGSWCARQCYIVDVRVQPLSRLARIANLIRWMKKLTRERWLHLASVSGQNVLEEAVMSGYICLWCTNAYFRDQWHSQVVSCTSIITDISQAIECWFQSSHPCRSLYAFYRLEDRSRQSISSFSHPTKFSEPLNSLIRS